MGASVNLSSKGNVFSLSGRDAILKESRGVAGLGRSPSVLCRQIQRASLSWAKSSWLLGSETLASRIPSRLQRKELEKDPIIAHTHRDKVKFYHEQLFRSHQMLLMDTATSEFLFLEEFFDTRGDHGLFVEVFGKTTQFFLDSLESFLASCWDSVGLLLMIRIVEYYRRCMQRRQVSCLDSYLDAQQLMIRPRLRMVLEENVRSLRRACQQNLPPVANTHPTHPHLVTRRYAELAASLFALSSPEVGGSLSVRSGIVSHCTALSRTPTPAILSNGGGTNPARARERAV